jgi:hypothetical protein
MFLNTECAGAVRGGLPTCREICRVRVFREEGKGVIIWFPMMVLCDGLRRRCFRKVGFS